MIQEDPMLMCSEYKQDELDTISYEAGEGKTVVKLSSAHQDN